MTARARLGWAALWQILAGDVAARLANWRRAQFTHDGVDRFVSLAFFKTEASADAANATLNLVRDMRMYVRVFHA
jgi:hypothetical protein